MSSMPRRALLRQIAPALFSGAIPILVWTPAQAAKDKPAKKNPVLKTVAKTIDAGQTLSFKLSEAWQGVLPAKKISIQSLVPPAKGKAVIKGKNAGAQVTYTPTPGFSGDDSFTIAAIAGGIPYTVRVSVVVKPPAPPPGILVSDAANFALVLSSAKPGDRIVLADGVYAGDFTITQPGTPEQPIVIMAARTLGATITGHIRVRAPDVSLVGLNVTLGIDLKGDRARASRCKVDGSGLEPPFELSGGTGVVVEFCELTNFGGRGLQIEDDAREPRIYRNWVHGQYGSDSDAIAGIIAGTGKGTSATPIAAHILENRVEQMSARQAIELKSSGNRVEGNTVVGVTKPADILVRHGLDNVLVSNWVENGRLLVGDTRTVAIRNRVSGSKFSPCIGVKAGTITGEQLRQGTSGYPISEGARLIANEAKVELGWRYSDWNLMPLATSLEAHNQAQWPIKVTLADPTQVSYLPATDFGPLPAAPQQLTRANVGPFGRA
jgi:hypothetical protein